MTNSAKGESERLTRKRRIDPKLIAAGWTIAKFDSDRPLPEYHNCAIEEYETDNGPADYALCVDGRILGIVEAKKVTLGPQNVLTQAERYSRGVSISPLDFNGFRVPFLYSTNGEVFWHHDIRHPLSRSRRISGFHTPKALTEMLAFDNEQSLAQLSSLLNDHKFIRPYQKEANFAVEQALADHKRHMLIAMATGTGKTYTLVNQAYRLMKSGVAKRILFLVDRRALAAQAVQTFASFEAEPGRKFDKIYEVYSQRFRRGDLDEDLKFDPNILPTSYLQDPSPALAFVYVCTIQRMTINLFGREGMLPSHDDEAEDDDSDRLNIPIHAFDVIIADECHRGYTAAELSVWRNTLEHFDAIKIGLTATPAHHTTSYFKDVVYRYEYERAVREGYLVDYDVVGIKSDVKMQGVFLNEGEQVGIINPDTGTEQLDLLEDEREFEPTDVERKVTSPDSSRKILEEIRKYALEHQEEYGRLPKILIFAENDIPHTSHADQLVEIARDIFGLGDSFVQKITGKVDRPLQRIREFRNRENPGIVVTVDMLSTGVDIPDLEFIVFLRKVKSRILFEQMLGRGTRKGSKFPDKSHFTVFDCFDGTLLEAFRNATAITASPPQKEHRTIVDIIQDIWANRDRKYNVRCLVKRMQRIDKEMSAEAREAFSGFIPAGDVSRYATELPANLHGDFSGTMTLLRDKQFQYLLINYPRAPRTFVIAYETEDTVSSEWLVRGPDGKEYKPDDYLQAFSAYIRENADKIEAIQILLERPKGWSTATLTELRNRLKSAPLRFTEKILQKAHEVKYHKALADIISMVKHAAREEEQLHTAEERVNAAVERIMASQTFTEEQLQWLERINAHLVQNLSIDREDFESLPVFTDYGGWKRAGLVFQGRLPDLITRLNEAVAA